MRRYFTNYQDNPKASFFLIEKVVLLRDVSLAIANEVCPEKQMFTWIKDSIIFVYIIFFKNLKKGDSIRKINFLFVRIQHKKKKLCSNPEKNGD